MKTFKIEIERWNPKNETVTSSTGFRYLDTSSHITGTQVLEGTKDEIFLKFYKMNNSLKYCNGSHFTFKDKQIAGEYSANFSKYNTMDNYYGNGVVD